MTLKLENEHPPCPQCGGQCSYNPKLCRWECTNKYGCGWDDEKGV